jgi:hypothetical protein
MKNKLSQGQDANHIRLISGFRDLHVSTFALPPLGNKPIKSEQIFWKAAVGDSKGAIYSMKKRPFKNTILMGTERGHLIEVETRTKNVRDFGKLHDHQVRGIATSQDGSIAYTCSNDGSLKKLTYELAVRLRNFAWSLTRLSMP